MRLIKLSGHQVDSADFLRDFATAAAQLTADQPLVIVNGGGRLIAELQTKLGLSEHKIAGLRVTDAETLQATEMVLSGSVNKLIVRALQAAGVDAIGISGVDGKLLQARRKTHPDGELGFVGHIETVNVEVIHRLHRAGFTPVVSPVSLALEDPTGVYNVNGDDAATAVAQAVAATHFDFVSNVPGLMRDPADPSTLIHHLTPADVDALIADGTIAAGMVPKSRAAVAALHGGVEQVRIVDLLGLPALTAGTHFTLEK